MKRFKVTVKAYRDGARPPAAIPHARSQAGPLAIRNHMESSGLPQTKKAANPKDSRTSAEHYAPHWEAPNGPPGGHFRAEEASPENLFHTLPA